MKISLQCLCAMACAAAAQTYEECHVSRGGATARERAMPGRRRLLPNATAAEAGRRRLLPKPITKEPGPKPAGSVTFLVVSRARSGTDWLRAMLNDHRRVCMEDEAVNDIRTMRTKLLRKGEPLDSVDRQSDALLQKRLTNVASGNFIKRMRRKDDALKCRCNSEQVCARGFKWFNSQGGACPLSPEVYSHPKYKRTPCNAQSNETLREWIRDNEARVIYLERLGVEKYMSSFARENRTLPSHCATDACAQKVAAGVGTVRVDVHNLLRKLRLQQAEMAALRDWAAAAGAAYLSLQYDELRRDPVGVVSRIYAFLDAEPHETRPDLYTRSMRKPLSEYFENLDEVREALRGTPWAADPVLA
jgi:hypothetical protein